MAGTTARKTLHDVSSEPRGRHRQSSQSEPSIALQCLPRLVWGERIRQWCFQNTGGRSTVCSEGFDDDVVQILSLSLDRTGNTLQGDRRSENSDGDALVVHRSHRAIFSNSCDVS